MSKDFWILDENGHHQRDPDRIPGILEALQQVWEKHPQLRLGQLIDNLAHPDKTFVIEDEELMDKLLNYG